jgi:small-conductance mechanosensitive channel/CRP-like cAMP-binding protein
MLTYGDIAGVISDPFVQTGALAVVGAVVTRILLRDLPTCRLLGQLLFFLGLTALLLYHGIVPYEVSPSGASSLERTFIGVAKIIWWANAAWVLIGVVRVFLILDRQPREGRLLQDLVVGVIYAGVILSVIAYVFNAPVGTLIATSGVFAIILGLAMQSTLSDVFSGIALNIGRPYASGDWLLLGDQIEGRVVETNWRATHLLNGANDLVIIPNSDLAKARFTNRSGPNPTHRVTLTARFAPTAEPSALVEVMRTVLLSSNSILTTPEPSVHVASLDGSAVGLELSFWVGDIASVGKAKSEVFDLIYRHAKANGLVLSSPVEAGSDAFASRRANNLPDGRTTPLRLLDAVRAFGSLTEDQKNALSARMTSRRLRKGEVLAEQGMVLDSLMILHSGVAAITRRNGTQDVDLGRLSPGNFFGEGGLSAGAGEPGTIRALTSVVVYEITQEGLAPLLRDCPSMAEELASALARRRARHADLLERDSDSDPKAAPHLGARIRHLFNT